MKVGVEEPRSSRQEIDYSVIVRMGVPLEKAVGRGSPSPRQVLQSALPKGARDVRAEL